MAEHRAKASRPGARLERRQEPGAAGVVSPSQACTLSFKKMGRIRRVFKKKNDTILFYVLKSSLWPLCEKWIEQDKSGRLLC